MKIVFKKTEDKDFIYLKIDKKYCKKYAGIIREAIYSILEGKVEDWEIKA